MKAVVFYGVLVGVMLWRLPQVRRQGSRRVTVLWVILWLLAAAAVGFWLMTE
jgi:hypothetical protein